MSERGHSALPVAFEQVHAQVDRRALGERPALIRRLGAEACLKRRRQPFGIVAAHRRRSAVEVATLESVLLFCAERRRGMAFASEQTCDLQGGKTSQLL